MLSSYPTDRQTVLREALYRARKQLPESIDIGTWAHEVFDRALVVVAAAELERCQPPDSCNGVHVGWQLCEALRQFEDAALPNQSSQPEGGRS